jgi:hypothetical protein
MMLFSAGMLVIRCMTIVVLGLLGGGWITVYIGADMLLYLLVKVLRGDFWYWIPAGGSVEILSSIVFRVVVKVVTDFTSIVQFRHPYELGGMYWILGFVFTMGSLPLATILASKEREAVSENGIELSWTVIVVFMPCIIICFFVFFLSMESKFWGTFFTLERGKDFTVRLFKEATIEDSKAEAILNNSRHHWKSIEEEVKSWVEVNWERWEKDNPSWLSNAWRARIPIEFIPSKEGKRRESVRRASVDAEAEGGLAGALRTSIRRASVEGSDGVDIIGVGGGKAKVSSVVPYEDEE